MFWLQCSLTSLLQLLFSFYVKGYAQFYFRFYVWVLGLIAFFFDYACLQAPEWSGGKFSQLSISGIIHGDLRSSRPGGSYGLTCMLDGSEGLFFEFERKENHMAFIDKMTQAILFHPFSCFLASCCTQQKEDPFQKKNNFTNDR